MKLENSPTTMQGMYKNIDNLIFSANNEKRQYSNPVSIFGKTVDNGYKTKS